mgnify:FL=1
MLSLELRSVNDFIINITRFVYKICTINRDPCCAGLWQILEENRYPLSIIKHVSLCSVYVFITSHVCINDKLSPCLKKIQKLRILLFLPNEIHQTQLRYI